MNIMGHLQQLGRSLMLPTIVLPAAAVFLALSGLPWASMGMPSMHTHLQTAGETLFVFLPYLFAFGVAMGMTSNAGTAGLAAIAGMFIYTSIINASHYELEPTVFTGVIIGIVTSILNEKFKSIKLPEYIQFFGGPRFVPLIVSVFSTLWAIIMVQIAPTIHNALIELGNVVNSGGGFGVFLFGFVLRILVVFGLHHLVSHVFWFQVGGYQVPGGHMVFGDLPRFFAGDPTAGGFMAGLYPTMMFALPAIAFAIIHEAREDLKPNIRKTFLTAALASFLTGVTEPIEFAFLFVAPYLFVVHALLSGFMMWLTYELGIRTGFSFSAGAIDFLINEHLATRGWLIIPIGIVFGLIYYVMFRWAIRRFRIPTPGREEGSQLDEWAGDIPYRAPLILQAIGGKENIVQMEACITRLRLKVGNDKLIDNNALKHLGAAGVIRLGGGNVQIVFGTYSELIREEMNKAIRRDISQGALLFAGSGPDDAAQRGARSDLRGQARRGRRRVHAGEGRARISGARQGHSCLSVDARDRHSDARRAGSAAARRHRYVAAEGARVLRGRQGRRPSEAGPAADYLRHAENPERQQVARDADGHHEFGSRQLLELRAV